MPGDKPWNPDDVDLSGLNMPTSFGTPRVAAPDRVQAEIAPRPAPAAKPPASAGWDPNSVDLSGLNMPTSFGAPAAPPPPTNAAASGGLVLPPTAKLLYADGAVPTTEKSQVVSHALREDEGFWRSTSPEEELEQETLGTQGIDVAGMRRDIRRYKFREALDRATAANGGLPITPEAEEALFVRASNEAHEEIRQMLDNADNASTMFIDVDPEGTTQRLATQGPGTVGQLLLDANPLYHVPGTSGVLEKAVAGAGRVADAWLMPYSHRTYEPRQLRYQGANGEILERTVSEWGDSYNRQGAWGWLQWIGQASPSAALATAKAAGAEIEAREVAEKGEEARGTDIPFLQALDDIWRGWGTEEQLHNIRSGEEMIDYSAAIGSSREVNMLPPVMAARPLAEKGAQWWGFAETDAEAKAFVDNMLGVGISLGVALVEPDLIFFTTAGLGKIPRVGQKAVEAMSTLPRLERTGDELVQGSADIAGILRRADEEHAAARAVGSSPETALDAVEGAPRRMPEGKGFDGDVPPSTVPEAEWVGEAISRVNGVLRRLPPEVRSSVNSHVSAMLGWAPMLEHKTQRALEGAQAAERRINALRLKYQARTVSATEDAVGTLRAASDNTGNVRGAGRSMEQVPRGQRSKAAKERSFHYEAIQGDGFLARMARTSLAKAEWAAATQREFAESMLVSELKAYRELLARLGGQGARRMTEAEHVKMGDQARAVWAEAEAARRAFYGATDEAAAMKAERDFVRARGVFRSLSQRMVDEMGAAGLSQLDETIKLADAARAEAHAQVRSLAHLMTIHQTQGKLNKVRKGTTFLNQLELLGDHTKALETVATSQRAAGKMVRGAEFLRVVQRSLDAHAASYRALSGAIKSGEKYVPVVERTALAALDEVVAPLPKLVEGVSEVSQEAAQSILRVMTSLYGPEALRKAQSPLLERLQDVARAAESKTAIHPNDLRQMIRSAATAREISFASPKAIAGAAEARRPWMAALVSVENKSFMAATAHRTVLTLHRFAKMLDVPTSDVLGPGSKVMTQIAKGGLDAQRAGLHEISQLFDSAIKSAAANGLRESEAIEQAVIKYLDGTGAADEAMGFESILQGVTTGSIWEQSRAFMLQMADAGVETAGMKALAAMWFKSGVDMEIWAKRLTGAMKAALRKSRDYDEFIANLGDKAGLSSEDMGLLWTHGKMLMEVEDALRAESSFSAFATRMRNATEMAISGGPPNLATRFTLSSEVGRAYGLAAQGAMQGAVFNRMTQQIAGELAGFTEDSLRAAMSITEGFDPFAKGHYEEAMALHDRMGIPPKIRELASDTMNDLQAGLIMLNKADSTEAALLPRQWISQMDSQIGNIVKRTDEFASAQTNPIKRVWAATVGRWWKLWRTSITTGVIWHSPRYLTAMMAGNLAQVFSDPLGGMAAAGRSLAQMGTYAVMHSSAFSPLRMVWHNRHRVPLLRGALDKIHDGMIAKFGPDHALGSPVAALYNPHVANFFDSAKAPADLTIKTADGDFVTMGWLRDEALRQGVVSSYASNELMDLLSRSSKGFDRDIYAPMGLMRKMEEGFSKGVLPPRPPGMGAKEYAELVKAGEVERITGLKGAAKAGKGHAKRMLAAATPGWDKSAGPLKFLERRSQVIADFADSIEQRQRVALFLDHVVNRGYSSEKAGALVRESLYDWGHAMSQWEADYLNKVVLFWRFWRVMLRQGTRILGSGFMRGLTEAGMKGTLGPSYATSTGRMKVMTQAAQGARIAAQRDMDALADEDDRAWMQSQIYPWWGANKATPFLSNMPLNEAEAGVWREQWGKDVTHRALAMPNLTPMDSVSMLLSGMGTIGRVATGSQSVASGAQGGINTVADMANPALADGIREIAKGFTGGSGESQWTSPPKLRPSEKLILGGRDAAVRYAGMDDWFAPWTFYERGTPGDKRTQTDDAGTVRVSPALAALLRMTPVLASEIPYWFDPMLTRQTASRDGTEARLSEEMMFLARQYTGLAKEYVHNPQQSRDYQLEQLGRNKQGEISRRDRRRYLSYSEDRDMWGREIDE
jgi:hypothetical protein